VPFTQLAQAGAGRRRPAPSEHSVLGVIVALLLVAAVVCAAFAGFAFGVAVGERGERRRQTRTEWRYLR
jgi:hypothetical protein